jgi:hypothetical protein
MAITCTHITTGASTTDGTSFATASVTPSANKLYLLFISNTKATTADAVSSVSGNGLTWVSVASRNFNTSNVNRISVYRAMIASAPSAGAITITFAASQTGCAWSLLEIDGVETSGSDGAGAIAQFTSSLGTSTTPLATLNAFDDATNNATVGGFSSAAASTYTAGTNFAIKGQTTYLTPSSSIATEFFAGSDTTVDATIASAAWGSIAIEIVALRTVEIRRPTADSDGGDACALGGSNTASSAAGNAYDADLTTNIIQTAAGTTGHGTGVDRNKSRIHSSWAAAGGAYSSLKLKIRSSSVTDSGSTDGGGATVLSYSLNGGSSWTVLHSGSFGTGWSVVTDSITLSPTQDLSLIQVRCCAWGGAGDLDVALPAGSGSVTIYDIRTEGVLAPNKNRIRIIIC